MSSDLLEPVFALNLLLVRDDPLTGVISCLLSHCPISLQPLSANMSVRSPTFPHRLSTAPKSVTE